MALHRNTRRAIAVAALAGASAAAQAGTFSCLSTSVSDCGIATANITWDWNGLDFTISNAGGGYVSEVYFDLSGGMSASFFSGTGTVNFLSSPVNPGQLPGGNAVGFASDAGFDSDPGTGQPVNGINAGETATFRILGAAANSFDLGQLASGLHVRSVPVSGNSVSLVTLGTPSVVTPVPEPESYAMMAIGLGVVGWVTRRRRKA